MTQRQIILTSRHACVFRVTLLFCSPSVNNYNFPQVGYCGQSLTCYDLVMMVIIQIQAGLHPCSCKIFKTWVWKAFFNSNSRRIPVLIQDNVQMEDVRMENIIHRNLSILSLPWKGKYTLWTPSMHPMMIWRIKKMRNNFRNRSKNILSKINMSTSCMHELQCGSEPHGHIMVLAHE